MLLRIWALVRKEFIHLRHDWWLPAFMLIGGAMELLLIGWATSRPITNLPLMVFDQDQSTASREIVQKLENTGTFIVQKNVAEMETIEHAIERGEINAAIIIPPDYLEKIKSVDESPVLFVILNGAESTPAKEALRTIEGVARDIGEQITFERLQIDPEQFAGFNPSLRVWFNEALSEALYTTPAELSLMLEFTILLFAALSFTRERELGTLEQLLVMPFSSLDIILGKSIPVILIGFVDFLILLSITHFAFGVPVRGPLPLLLLLVFIYILVELGKGFVISVISRTQHQAFLIVLIVGMVDFMFTGYAAPVESMPQALQIIANVVPAHHMLAITRGILLKGAGLETLWFNVLALIILGILIGTFSFRFVRRALD
ncbi:MAG: ABC transporter permease [Anaerolineales bacterium]|jgi:ABC-2 type transport system permease protein